MTEASLKRFGNDFHVIDGDIPLTPFHGANVRSMKPAPGRELLLGYSEGVPRGLEISGKDKSRGWA